MRHGIRIRKENETDVKPEITLIMEIVNIEARTFEAMLSAFRTFADRLDTLCRLYGDMEEKKWLDNQEVCLLLKVLASMFTISIITVISGLTSVSFSFRIRIPFRNLVNPGGTS